MYIIPTTILGTCLFIYIYILPYLMPVRVWNGKRNICYQSGNPGWEECRLYDNAHRWMEPYVNIYAQHVYVCPCGIMKATMPLKYRETFPIHLLSPP